MAGDTQARRTRIVTVGELSEIVGKLGAGVIDESGFGWRASKLAVLTLNDHFDITFDNVGPTFAAAFGSEPGSVQLFQPTVTILGALHDRFALTAVCGEDRRDA